ncbi:uncharacterized protein LOC143292700 isoform X2 [Babylonia areolata]|uniref:uncharacterized protein LOC143292700 isoform X2 n=1 Tax=Babylonia areolata TaxID=304850 RepID=UPI003FD523E0
MSLERLRREFQNTMRLLEERRGRLVHALCSPAVSQRCGRRHTHGEWTVSSSAEVGRPNTAAVLVGGFQQCERVQQLQRESTRRSSLEPSRSAASRQRKAQPWVKQATPLVPFLAGPGYILSRGKCKFDVMRRKAGLAPSPEEEEQKRLQDEAEREVLIAQLQQQVSDLNLFLEEERMNHRHTKQKSEQYLRDRLEQQRMQHNEHTREVKARHKEEARKQKTEQDAEFTEFQTNTENHICKLSKEVEQLHGAFEAYKSCLQGELHDKWTAMETQLKKDCDDAVQAATLDMKAQLTRERVAERAEAVKEQRRQMEALRKQHKKDKDNVFRKYSREAAGLERLQKSTVELTEVRKEVDDMRTKYLDNSDRLASATSDLTDMKVQLMDFEQRFQTKVTEVDDKYRHKLHDLMAQNSQLRLLYMDKCGQLFDEQSSSSARVMLQVKAARAAMESQHQHRNNDDRDLGSNPGPSAKSPRPSSAPGTPRETESANLMTRDTSHHQEKNTLPPNVLIPPEDPETKRPRQGGVVASGGSLVKKKKKKEEESLLNTVRV